MIAGYTIRPSSKEGGPMVYLAYAIHSCLREKYSFPALLFWPCFVCWDWGVCQMVAEEILILPLLLLDGVPNTAYDSWWLAFDGYWLFAVGCNGSVQACWTDRLPRRVSSQEQRRSRKVVRRQSFKRRQSCSSSRTSCKAISTDCMLHRKDCFTSHALIFSRHSRHVWKIHPEKF